MADNGGGGVPERITHVRPELADVIRRWRERIDPRDIPGWVASSRHRYVTQEDAARLIGVSTTWYGKLERGESGIYSDDLLDRTAICLRLTEAEREILYHLAVNREPPPRYDTVGKEYELPEQLRQLVLQQQVPAYVSDDAWDILAYNGHMADWFPWVTSGLERNIMRWSLTYPEARRQLHRWNDVWAPLMLAQVRVAQARQPFNGRLNRVSTEIRESSPFMRKLWDSADVSIIHPDGDRREIFRPRDATPIPIELIALAPLRAQSSRLMILMPIKQAAPHLRLSPPPEPGTSERTDK